MHLRLLASENSKINDLKNHHILIDYFKIFWNKIKKTIFKKEKY